MISNKSIVVFVLVLVCLAFVVEAAPPPHPHDIRFGVRRRHHRMRSVTRRCAKRAPAAVSRTALAAGSAPTQTEGLPPAPPVADDDGKDSENGNSDNDHVKDDDKDDGKDHNNNNDDKPEEEDDGDNEPVNVPSGPGGAESLKALFPLGQNGASWSTSSAAKGSSRLTNDFLRPTKDMKSLSHDITKAPDGKSAMEAFYPKGSMNPGNSPAGGFSFYAPGPSDVNIEGAKEVTFGYSVFFEKGFDWVKGGKLPGVFGGNSFEDSVSCSGGRRDDKCFSARLMWRPNGEGEFYNYFPPSFGANRKQCNVAPESDCNDKFGASVGRGAFHFKDGAWTTVAERVRLNDAGKENGEIEMFVNGKSVINVKGLVLRGSDKGKFRGVQMQTFFGGSSNGFQASRDSKVWFKDFSLAITQAL